VQFFKLIAAASVILACALTPARAEPAGERNSDRGDSCAGATASLALRPAAPLSAAEECILRPKDSFRECENCPEMVVVPAGAFTMGSPSSEEGRGDTEGPQHVVTIRKPYALGRVHVTVDQFAAFVRETGYAATSTCHPWLGEGSRSSWRSPGFTQEGSHPVVCVSWDDANAYVVWLAQKTGRPYRLPSEAEWEYAARGQTAPGAYPRFWFGNDEKDLCRYGNFDDREASAPCKDGFPRTSPGGSYTPNAFGLYDMFGNAEEWTADCWHTSYRGAPADGSAWTTGCQESGYVFRGSGWFDDPQYLRAASRSRHADGAIYNDDGFRVARTVTP
jgi:formylglycine-generating enzyme required for sulfatase activity